MFNRDFYPTPPEVIAQMLEGEKIAGKTILEPSAGTGNIIDYLQSLWDSAGSSPKKKPSNSVSYPPPGFCILTSDQFLKILNPKYTNAAN